MKPLTRNEVQFLMKLSTAWQLNAISDLMEGNRVLPEPSPLRRRKGVDVPFDPCVFFDYGGKNTGGRDELIISSGFNSARTNPDFEESYRILNYSMTLDFEEENVLHFTPEKTYIDSTMDSPSFLPFHPVVENLFEHQRSERGRLWSNFQIASFYHMDMCNEEDDGLCPEFRGVMMKVITAHHVYYFVNAHMAF